MSIRSPTTFCFEAIKWIPVIFIFGLIAWSYYAYVVQMCICKFIIKHSSNIILNNLVTIENVPKKGKNQFVFCLIIYLKRI